MAGNQMLLIWDASWYHSSWYHKELVELQRSLSSERKTTGYVASDRARDLNNDDTANQIGQLLNIMRPYHEQYSTSTCHEILRYLIDYVLYTR